MSKRPLRKLLCTIITTSWRAHQALIFNDDNEGEEQQTVSNTSDELQNLIWFQNVRSLTANFDKLTTTLTQLQQQPIAVALQEIWAPKIQHTKLAGYHNLIAVKRKNKRGGGVGFFVNNKYNVENVKIKTEQNNIEHVWIYISEINTIIGSIYRPPSSDVLEGAKTLCEAMDEIEAIAGIKKCSIIIGGDYNVNFLESRQNHTIAITDIYNGKGYIANITQPTRYEKESSTQIDNIFSKGKNIQSNGVLLNDISDHLGVYVCIKAKKQQHTKQDKPERCFNEKHMSNLIKLLQAEKWELLLKTYNNDCFNIFSKTLDQYIKLTCSTDTKQSQRNRKKVPEEPWMTRGMLISRNNKDKLYKQYLNNTTLANFEKFKIFQKTYYKAIKKAKKLYVNKQLLIHHGDGKKIWETINAHTNRIKKNTPPIKQINSKGTTTEDPTTIANEFNTFFSEVGENLAKKINIERDAFRKTLPTHNAPKLIFQSITQEELGKIIKGMEAKTSSGHDHISNKILKQLYPTIKTPLLHVLNRSIENKFVPDTWKFAKIIPLHKKGSTKDTGNYRPISLLPTISKVIEKIIEKQTRKHLENNNLITQQQFGFRPAHETTHAVLKAVEFINKAWDRKESPMAVFCDLKKAFDTVNFQILTAKLQHYNIDTTWFESYLTNRRQYTLVNGVKSKTRTITCGVPQGSILGPLLFLIYINDLPAASKLNTILFADDTTLLTSAKTDHELILKTNQGLAEVAGWFKANGLTAHPEKTTFMVFNHKQGNTLNGTICFDRTKLDRIGEGEKEQTVKFVGIHIDEKLSWEQHKAHVHNKMQQQSYLISANKRILTRSTKKLLYNALIKPHIEYGLIAWGHTNLQAITTKQKKIIRDIYGTKNRIAHTNPLFSNLKLLKITDLVKINTLKFAKKFTSKSLPIALYSTMQLLPGSVETRAKKDNTILIPRKTNKNWSKTVFHVCPKLWNDLSSNTKNAKTMKSFTNILKKTTFMTYQLNQKCNKAHCASCK